MPARNLAPVVMRHAFAVVRRRYGADTLQENTLRAPGAAVDTPARAYLHGEPGSSQAQLAEGQSVAVRIHGYSVDLWRVSDDAAGVRADSVVWNGVEYALDWLRDWATSAGTRTWCEFTAQLVDRGAEVAPP